MYLHSSSEVLAYTLGGGGAAILLESPSPQLYMRLLGSQVHSSMESIQEQTVNQTVTFGGAIMMSFVDTLLQGTAPLSVDMGVEDSTFLNNSLSVIELLSSDSVHAVCLLFFSNPCPLSARALSLSLRPVDLFPPCLLLLPASPQSGSAISLSLHCTRTTLQVMSFLRGSLFAGNTFLSETTDQVESR